MPNFKIDISYDGTDFFGWQIQKNTRTVQGELTDAFSTIFSKHRINLIGSGRTDTGVHARHQIANIDLDTNLSCENIKNAINSNIGNDVQINSCEIADSRFNSRFSAVSREYIYIISNVKSPIKRKYSWMLEENFNFKLLNVCAEAIMGIHDFSSFCKEKSLKENNQCEITYSKWTYDKNNYSYKIIGNRFLHHMVRFLVGTMIEVGKSKVKFEDFCELLKNKNKSNLIMKAPPQGLYLNNIYYD